MVLNAETDKMIAQNDIPKGNFKKYPIISVLDKKWGFIINATPYTQKIQNTLQKGIRAPICSFWKTRRAPDHRHLISDSMMKRYLKVIRQEYAQFGKMMLFSIPMEVAQNRQFKKLAELNSGLVFMVKLQLFL
jgi:hypothetical protein